MKKALKIVGKILLWLLAIIIIFFVSMYFITWGNYSVPKTVENDKSLPHITVNNIVYHAETFGDKKNDVVVVIHGGPGNDYRYLLPLKALADDYFLVFYDQRGSGLSPRVEEADQSLENSLKDLSDIINYYSPEKKVYIIGHSWGAMLGSGYTAKNPSRVKKLVLAEPGMLNSERAKEFMKRFKIDFNFNMLKYAITIAFESLHLKNDDKQSAFDYILGRITGLDIKENPTRKYFCNEDIKTAHLPSWRIGAVASIGITEKGKDKDGNTKIDLVSGIENYKDKVLFIVGECNKIIGEDFQKEHLKLFPNAEMKVIKDAGHTMFGERPEESMRIIREYFKEE